MSPPQHTHMLERLRWMNGTFPCRKCGKEYHTMILGYGEAICPDCYQGEQPFLFLDNSYWFNRSITSLLRQKPQRKQLDIDSILIDQIHTHSEIEIT